MNQTTLNIYNKERQVQYRSAIAKERFLDGLPVKAVWVQIENDKGKMSKPYLIISTDIGLPSEQIIQYYAKRLRIITPRLIFNRCIVN